MICLKIVLVFGEIPYLALKRSDSTQLNMNKAENIKNRKIKYNKYFKAYPYYQFGKLLYFLHLMKYSIQSETVSYFASASSDLK